MSLPARFQHWIQQPDDEVLDAPTEPLPHPQDADADDLDALYRQYGPRVVWNAVFQAWEGIVEPEIDEERSTP
jgi:hypothetical protein